MKPFFKALLPALIPAIMITLLTILIHWFAYGSQAFEEFFGVTVMKFSLEIYIIVFLSLEVVFALIFKSDYEEEGK